jgi:tetratricopeptide (TPR) repeat protein
LKINNNGVLTIGDDVEINGYSGSSGIFNFNELYVGNNVYLHGDPTNDWGGIVVQSDELLDLQAVTFEDCYLTTNTSEIAIDDCNFIRSHIFPYVQNISINDTEITETLIFLLNPGPATGNFRIDNCTITAPSGNMDECGIYINNYDDYSITNCHIEGFIQNGARIVNSGFDINSRILIENNTIINNALYNNYAGLKIVYSFADIHNNFIANNDRGIILMANSTVKLRGDNTFSPTQDIINNKVHQLWSTDDSFPYYCKLNLMYGASPLLPYHIVYMSTQNMVQKDITRNCWGPDFDPINPQWFFWPVNMLTWNPYWNCNSSSSDQKTDDQLLFESAELKVTNDDYVGAEEDYQTLIETYPDSKYAKIALRDLFRLEKETGNDYQELKAFYENNQTIQNNEDMKNAADVLAINCEIRDENYFEALELLDEYMISPITDFNDSVFAIYEKNYIYDLLGNGGLKSTGATISLESSFSALRNYEKQQNETLDLLFRDNVCKESLENSLNELKPGMLLQNVPNPFTGSTDIYFKLEVEADVNIKIYNHIGQIIRNIAVGHKNKGKNSLKFNATDLNQGMYYYVLEINGKVSDSKKMKIIK